MKKVIIPISLLLISTLFGCSTNTSSNNTSSQTSSSQLEKVLPTSIKASEENINIKVGETVSFSYEILPQNSTENSVKYTFDDSLIAVDKENKTITGLAVGSTNLIFSTINNKKATISIKISNADNIQLESISTNFNRSVLAVGEELQISVTSLPAISNLKFKYSSSKSSVATVSSTGLLKGIAVGTCQIKISVENSDVTPITLSISVSADKNKINLDKTMSKIENATLFENTNIINGSIEMNSKSNAGIKKSIVNYNIYNDHIYNNITSFDGSNKCLYYGLLDDNLYTLVTSEGKIISSDKNKIGNNTFVGEVSLSNANKYVSLPAFYSNYYSSTYTYGLGSYVSNLLNDNFYDASKYNLTLNDNEVVFSTKYKDFTTATFIDLKIVFDNDNFKNVTFTKNVYNDSDVDESFNLKSDAVTKSYETCVANLVSGKREVENNPIIDASKFYFNDFYLAFYVSTDTEKKNPKTQFFKGDTIIFEPTSYKPEGVYLNFDRIEIISSSNTNVIDIAPNKTALNAVGEGKSTIVVKSKNVTKQYELSVNIANPTGIKFSSIADCITCEDEIKFYLNMEPFGANDDVTVSLLEGDEKYATITSSDINGMKYYHLKGNNNMTEKEHIVTIVAVSNVDKNVRAEKKVKIIKPLTSEEAYNILKNSTYKAPRNKEFHNYSVELKFIDESNAILNILKGDGSVYDSCKFLYSLNRGKFSTTSSNTVFTKGYVEDLSISIISPDYEKIDISFAEEDEEEGKLSVTYHLTREINS